MLKDLVQQRADLIKQIEKVEDESLLLAIKVLLTYGLKNEGRISIEQYNKEIEEANARISRGEYLTQEQVEALSGKW